MPEYIEREALITRLQKVRVIDNHFGMGIKLGTENAINCIKKAPTADVVKVVRCKDCEYLKLSYCYGECSKGYMGIVSPNDYCSRGKIRVIE